MAELIDFMSRLQEKQARVAAAELSFLQLGEKYPRILSADRGADGLMHMDWEKTLSNLLAADQSVAVPFRLSGKLEIVQLMVLAGNFFAVRYLLGGSSETWADLHRLPQPTYRVIPGCNKQVHYGDFSPRLGDCTLFEMASSLRRRYEMDGVKP